MKTTSQLLKQECRRTIIAVLKELTIEDRRRQEKAVATRLFQTDQWREAQFIALTKPMPLEFSLDLVVQQARQEQKKLFVPIVLPERQMQFVYWQEDTLFQKTPFGVEEPVNATLTQPLAAMDLVIVPGLLYTKKGERLGFGGGYYDRALQDADVCTMSLLYEQQLISTAKWPVEAWDVPIKMLITSKGVVEK